MTEKGYPAPDSRYAIPAVKHRKRPVCPGFPPVSGAPSGTPSRKYLEKRGLRVQVVDVAERNIVFPFQKLGLVIPRFA